jgi:hypothetical protein
MGISQNNGLLTDAEKHGGKEKNDYCCQAFR